jgi:hypothetical protein
MKTIHIKNWRSNHDVVLEPLTLEELNDSMSKAGMVTCKLLVSIEDLIDGDMEALNDNVSERITGSEAGLTDISYKLVGRQPQSNETIIGVTGHVEIDNL